jgi:hypothetical protein
MEGLTNKRLAIIVIIAFTVFLEVLPNLNTGERICEALRPFDYRYYLLMDHGTEERRHIRGDQFHLNYLARSPKRAPLRGRQKGVYESVLE